MANKLYYFLKLPENFFSDNKPIKKLRKLAGGDTYTIIYMKMLLASLKEGGKLIFEGLEESIAEEIALDIDEDPENVKVTVAFLLRTGLMTQTSDTEAFLTAVPSMVKKETSKAESMRQLRERRRQESLPYNNGVTNGNNVTDSGNTEVNKLQELELELELESELDNNITHNNNNNSYIPISDPPDVDNVDSVDNVDNVDNSEDEEMLIYKGIWKNVAMTDDEYCQLVEEYGHPMVADYINRISNYMRKNNKNYRKPADVIRGWIVQDLKRRNEF